MPKLNLSEADGNFTDDKVNPLVEEGVYGAVVKSADFEVDDKGREKIVMTFQVIQEGDVKDLSFRSWNYLHQADCKRISIENLENIGVPPNWHYKNTKVLVGKECRLKLIQGDGYMNIKSIMQRFVPNGVYDCVVQEVGEEESSYQNNTPFRRVFFLITNPGDPSLGLKIQERLFLTEKSLKITASKLKSFGAELAEFDTDSDRDWGSIKGLRVRITYVNTRGADGREFGKVTRYDALGRGGAASVQAVPAAAASAVVASSVVDVSMDDLAVVEDEIPF